MSTMTEKQTTLEELIFEVVEQFDRLWEITQRSLRALERIDDCKRQCADTEAEQEELVQRYTDRAWERVAAQRGIERMVAQQRASAAFAAQLM